MRGHHHCYVDMECRGKECYKRAATNLKKVDSSPLSFHCRQLLDKSMGFSHHRSQTRYGSLLEQNLKDEELGKKRRLSKLSVNYRSLFCFE